MVLIHLNSADERPIYVQIADQVKFAVASGVLRPKELIPSVRELSKHLVVNPNTVARAYRELQGEGLLETVRGTGLKSVPRRRRPASRSGGRSCPVGSEPRSKTRRERAGPGGNRVDPARGVGQRERAGEANDGGRTISAVPVILVEGLTKRYHGEPAVQGLSLEVPAGAVFGMLGENGAGKTTTIQALLGMVVPDEGRIRTLGLDPVRHGLEVRPTGGLRPRATGALRLDDGRGDRLVRGRFSPGRGLPGALQHIGRRLRSPARPQDSGPFQGHEGRGLARVALASEPELLVLDEPTSGLDVLVRPGISREHGRPRGSGADGLAVEPPDGRGGALASHMATFTRASCCWPSRSTTCERRTFVVSLTFAAGEHMDGPPPRVAARADRHGRNRANAAGSCTPLRPPRARSGVTGRRWSTWSSKRRRWKRSTSPTCEAAGGRPRQRSWWCERL